MVFVLSDFLMWFTHWVRHKVPSFWYFHAVHHAAPTLNVLTDNRVHFVEGMIVGDAGRAPGSAGSGSTARPPVALTIATTYFTAFTHTAVRWNLGPLRWILVTPAVPPGAPLVTRPEHIDTNFATVFSFWDILFRTQYMGVGRVPGDGHRRPRVPARGAGHAGRASAASYGRQVVYPFVQVGRDVGKYRRRRALARERASLRASEPLSRSFPSPVLVQPVTAARRALRVHQ